MCPGRRRWSDLIFEIPLYCPHLFVLPFCDWPTQVASLNRDKFLVTAVLLDREDTPAAQLADALRTQTPDGQYRSLAMIII